MNRLNHEEIAEIARLVARRGMRAQGMGPTSQEVGAVLGLSPSEVEAMLHELRLKNGGVPLTNPAIERRTVFLALGSVAALLIFAALFLLRSVFSGGAASGPNPATPSVANVSAPPTNDAAPSAVSASAPPSMAPVAQNSSAPSPSGLPPQFQDGGEVRYITSGSEVRRGLDSAKQAADSQTIANLK